MNNNITLSLHVKNNVLPKVKDKEIKEQFIQMSEYIDKIGVEGYAMTPKELISYEQNLDEIAILEDSMDSMDRRTEGYKLAKAKVDALKKNDGFTQNQWLTFLSHPVVSKFLEKQILKLNTVVYRQKLSQLASKADISQADIKYISILKEIVDEARNSEANDIIHISTFYPPREYYDSVKDEKSYKSELGVAVRENIEFLEIDTDYMSFVDVQKAKEKETRIKKNIDEASEIKQDSKAVEKIVDEKAEVKQKEIDDIFEGA